MATPGGPSRRTSAGGVLAVAVLAGLVILGALWFATRGARTPHDDRGHAPAFPAAITLPDGEVVDAIDAQSRCESMIRRQLPTPDSADFANRFSSAWQDPVKQGNAWRFVSTVDYRSATGASARAQFLCVLDGDANTITVQPLP